MSIVFTTHEVVHERSDEVKIAHDEGNTKVRLGERLVSFVEEKTVLGQVEVWVLPGFRRKVRHCSTHRCVEAFPAKRGESSLCNKHGSGQADSILYDRRQTVGWEIQRADRCRPCWIA